MCINKQTVTYKQTRQQAHQISKPEDTAIEDKMMTDEDLVWHPEALPGNTHTHFRGPGMAPGGFTRQHAYTFQSASYSYASYFYSSELLRLLLPPLTRFEQHRCHKIRCGNYKSSVIMTLIHKGRPVPSVPIGIRVLNQDSTVILRTRI